MGRDEFKNTFEQAKIASEPKMKLSQLKATRAAMLTTAASADKKYQTRLPSYNESSDSLRNFLDRF